MKDDGYMRILGSYIMSIFQDFGSYLSTEVYLVEDDIKLVLDEYNSSFISFELTPGIYTFKDLSEALFNIIQPEYPGPPNVIDIEFDDITMETKLVVKPGIIAIRFDEQSFFSTVLGLTQGWYYKHYSNYISQKFVNLSITKKIHLKCDAIDGIVVNGLRQLIKYIFVLDKLPGCKIFSEPETMVYRKVNKII